MGKTGTSTVGALGAAAFSPTRRAIRRLVVRPGSGPSPELQRSGFFRLRFHGVTDSGDEIDVAVTGNGDPGYSSTSRMPGDAALTLLEKTPSAVSGGFWTPATALGDLHVDALRAHAGMSFEVLVGPAEGRR